MIKKCVNFLLKLEEVEIDLSSIAFFTPTIVESLMLNFQNFCISKHIKRNGWLNRILYGNVYVFSELLIGTTL